MGGFKNMLDTISYNVALFLLIHAKQEYTPLPDRLDSFDLPLPHDLLEPLNFL